MPASSALIGVLGTQSLGQPSAIGRSVRVVMPAIRVALFFDDCWISRKLNSEFIFETHRGVAFLEVG
jgi:hypothetical protein